MTDEQTIDPELADDRDVLEEDIEPIELPPYDGDLFLLTEAELDAIEEEDEANGS